VNIIAVVGLTLNLLGALIIASAQNQLFIVINGWLIALDFFVETSIQQKVPVTVRFEGWDKQMEQQLPKTRKRAGVGWALIVIGVAIQIPAALAG
jgi:hypothetical protein